MMSAAGNPEGTRHTVAVVLCTYNGARYLSEQLDSLLGQSRRPDQLVIVDDDSSDGTWALLESFAVRARAAGIDVRLERNPENLGYRRNFERASGLARADLIFLCDQDDIWCPDKIARMEAEFLGRPALLLLHTDARLVDARGAGLGCSLFDALELTADEVARLHAGDGFEMLMRRNVVTGATSAFRSAILRWAIPFPDLWVHDEWLAVVAAASGEVDCLETPLIAYRQHGGNQIGVQILTAREKLVRERGLRRRHMRTVAQRLEQLEECFDKRCVALSDPERDTLRQRRLHARARADLPRPWPARWHHVLAEARSGRYRRFSFGFRSVVADLMGLD